MVKKKVYIGIAVLAAVLVILQFEFGILNLAIIPQEGGFQKETGIPVAQISPNIYKFTLSNASNKIAEIRFLTSNLAGFCSTSGQSRWIVPQGTIPLYINNQLVASNIPSGGASMCAGQVKTPPTWVKISSKDTTCDNPDANICAPPVMLCITNETLMANILNNTVNGKTFEIKGIPIPAAPGSDCGTVFGGVGQLSVIYKPDVLCPSGQVVYNDQCVTPEPLTDALHYRKYTCPIQPGYQTILESYAQGTSINKGTFKFTPNYFCELAPLIAINEVGQKLYASTSQYGDIVAGKTVTVPAGEVWSFTYIAKTTGDMPIICPSNSTYSTGDKACVVTPGIIYACTSGQFDPVQGLCVSQPESTVMCDKGYYDTSMGKCVFQPATVEQCPEGQYDETTNRCLVTPISSVVCLQGTFDASKNICILNPKNVIICEKGTYDETTKTCKVSPSYGYTGELSFISQYFHYIIGAIILLVIIVGYWLVKRR